MQQIVHLSILIMCVNISCMVLQNTKGTTYSSPKQAKKIVYAEFDLVADAEVRQYIEQNFETVYEYYQLQEDESEDTYVSWSQKMFGRCCTEADLDVSEIVFFTIDSNVPNAKYPASNLSDTRYGTPYAFQKKQQPKIRIKVDKEKDYFGLDAHKYFEKIDTLAQPLTLSLVNGYAQSEELFYKTARVKQMDVFLNGDYQATVKLLDTPLIQQFTIDVLFTIDDVLTLIPISTYGGSIYKDICISEIQQNLGASGHANLNKKYPLND